MASAGGNFTTRRTATRIGVHLGHSPAQPGTDPDAQGGSEDRDQHRPLHEVPRDCRVRVTDSLEHGDLLTLNRDHAREHDVEQKRRHHQEDDGDRLTHRLEPRHLVGDIEVRRLQAAGNRAHAAVGSQKIIEPVDDLLLRRTAHESEHDVVEATFHVEGSRQGAPVHPHHAEAFVVWQDLTGPNAVDVLGRQRQADDLQLAASPVDHRGNLVAGAEPMSEGEVLGHDYLVGLAGLDPSPLAQEQIVENGAPHLGNSDQPANRRLGKSLDINGDIRDDPGLGMCDARNLADLVTDSESNVESISTYSATPAPITRAMASACPLIFQSSRMSLRSSGESFMTTALLPL